MKLIGLKRALYLFILLGVNAVLAAAFFLLLEPMRTDSETELDSVKGQISELNGKISNIKQEMKLYQENKPKYDALAAKGFSLPQDNFMIEKTLDDLRARSGLMGFSFEISDLKDVDNGDAKTAKVRLVTRRISLRQVKSLIDINFYDFINQMYTAFPVQVRLNNFTLRQTPTVDPTALKAVTAGKSVGFIDGDMAFDWFTVIPQGDEKDKNKKAGGQ